MSSVVSVFVVAMTPDLGNVQSVEQPLELMIFTNYISLNIHHTQDVMIV